MISRLATAPTIGILTTNSMWGASSGVVMVRAAIVLGITSVLATLHRCWARRRIPGHRPRDALDLEVGSIHSLCSDQIIRD